MMRMENQQRQSWKDWDEVDGVKDEAGSTEKVKHIESNDQLSVTSNQR